MSYLHRFSLLGILTSTTLTNLLLSHWNWTPSGKIKLSLIYCEHILTLDIEFTYVICKKEQ